MQRSCHPTQTKDRVVPHTVLVPSFGTKSRPGRSIMAFLEGRIEGRVKAAVESKYSRDLELVLKQSAERSAGRGGSSRLRSGDIEYRVVPACICVPFLSATFTLVVGQVRTRWLLLVHESLRSTTLLNTTSSSRNSRHIIRSEELISTLNLELVQNT